MKTGVKLMMALTLLTLTSCKTAMLVNPGRMTVAAQDRDQMASAIKQALFGRRWAIAKEEPGVIHATLFARSHVAKIKIVYDRESFDIQYVDSTNLKYQKKPDGTEYIHRHYNSWIQNLVNDINLYASHAE